MCTRKRRIKKLLIALENKDRATHREAAMKLIAMGEPGSEKIVRIGKKAVVPLIRALGYSMPVVNDFRRNYYAQEWATGILIRLGEPAVLPLIEALENKNDGLLTDSSNAFENRFVQEAAVRALAEIGDIRAVDPLIRALGERTVYDEATEALGKIGEPAINALIKALEGKDYSVCSYAAKALGIIGEPAKAPLMKVLDNEDEAIRSLAAKVLQLIG